MDTAFVLGATGLTGRAVVATLCKRRGAGGGRVVAHVRPDSPRRAFWQQHFEGLGAEVDTTAWDEGAMRATIERLQPSAVFALLGTTRKRERLARARGIDAGYEAVDYGLTMLALHACIASGARPRFVYLSAAGVGPRTHNPYLRVRHAVEEELHRSGLPFVIARPSFILGERDEARPLEKIGAAVADTTLALAGMLGARRTRERYRSTTGEGLARALVALSEDEQTDGRTVESDELQARARSSRLS